MPGTYSQILLHVIFSTKNRRAWIQSDLETRLYAFMGGIIRSEKGALLEIGGVEDHLHLYLRWRPDGSISNLLRTLKARTSRWIHEHFPDHQEFTWQEGYAVFSVSKSQENAIRKYYTRAKRPSSKNGFQSGTDTIFLKPAVSISMKGMSSIRGRRVSDFLCPSGAGGPTDSSHGLRSAPPVATFRRP